MNSGKSVLVIGGGVIGLSVAYSAMKRGLSVTLMDRNGPDGDNCSRGNAGMIVPSHVIPLAAPGMVAQGLKMMLKPDSPFYFRPDMKRETWEWAWKFHRSANAAHVARSAPLLCKLNLESRKLFQQLTEEIGDFGLEERGILQLCRTEAGLHEEGEAAHFARSLGLAAEVLSPEDAQKLEPGLRMMVAGGIYYPMDAHLDPQRLTSQLRRALEEGGVTFKWNAEMTGAKFQNGRLDAIQTSKGDFSADAYVLAAGSASSNIAKMVNLSLPMVGGKVYSMTLPSPKIQFTIPVLLTEARVAITPMGSALRVGGTMEIGGDSGVIHPERVKGIQDSMPLYFPDYGPSDFEGVPVWSGQRPCSPDGLPYIGPFTRYSNLYAATGHAMMGVSLAPVTGQLIAEMMTEEPPSHPLALLKPDRF